MIEVNGVGGGMGGGIGGGIGGSGGTGDGTRWRLLRAVRTRTAD
jgi:hypothetical protein